MSKKRNAAQIKLKLDDLKIQSFVTSLNQDTPAKLKGGRTEGGPVPECIEYTDPTDDTGTINSGPFMPGCASFACTGLTCAFCNPTDGTCDPQPDTNFPC